MIKHLWDELWFLIIISLFVIGVTIVSELLISYQKKHPLTYKEFDGHEYVIYHIGLRDGFTHSPNCHCLTNKVEEVK